MNGPDIRNLMKSQTFTDTLHGDYLKAWKAIEVVISKVLGGKRAEEKEMVKYVKAMMNCFKKLKSSMTLKMHLINNHLKDFMQQSPTESDEHGERFHQTIMALESRFKGKRLDALLAEMCWASNVIYSYENSRLVEKGEQKGHGDEDESSDDEGIRIEEEDSDEEIELAPKTSEGPFFEDPNATDSSSSDDEEPETKKMRSTSSTEETMETE